MAKPTVIFITMKNHFLPILIIHLKQINKVFPHCNIYRTIWSNRGEAWSKKRFYDYCERCDASKRHKFHAFYCIVFAYK